MDETNTLLHSFNAFQNTKASQIADYPISSVGGYNQSSLYNRSRGYNGGDLINSVISIIALEVSQLTVKHLKIDRATGNQTPVDSDLIECLTTSANIDQTGSSLLYDIAWSLLEENTIAIVPVETTDAPNENGAYDISSLRTGKIMQWYPQHVRVRSYDENEGVEKDILLSKKNVAIIESPMATVLNRQNRIIRTLERKNRVMMSEDNNAAAGKLNAFLQVPYATNNTVTYERARNRVNAIESQLASSRYGLSYLDASEKYIPTGGGIANNLLEDIRKLEQDFYTTVGVTANVLDGTASESEYNRFFARAVDPIAKAIFDGINRTFLTKTARTQGQSVFFYRDPFKGLPIEQYATAADLLIRNAIFSPNEMRAKGGAAPSLDPLANKLFNRNIADGNQSGGLGTAGQANPVAGEVNPEVNPEANPEASGDTIDTIDHMANFQKNIDTILQDQDSDPHEVISQLEDLGKEL